MLRLMVYLLLLVFSCWQVSAQEKLRVAGKMVITETNRIATFQSTSANAFIGLAPNENPSMGTNVGYFDNGPDDQYYFIDTPGGDFGEFRISSSTGNVGIGSAPSTNARLYVSSSAILVNAIKGISKLSYGVYGESEENVGIFGISRNSIGIFGQSLNDIGILGRGGFDSNTSIAQPDFWAYRGIYGSDSSKRWKSNIKNIEDPLKLLSRIRGVTFTWDEDHGGGPAVGFIAEEVGEVLPEAVFYESNGVDARGMDYTKVIPLVVEAANTMRKEYQAKFDRQEQAIAQQQRELDEIKALLNQLLYKENNNTNLNLGSLLQNQPNPFREATLITYAVPEGTGSAELQITDMSGRVVKRTDITARGEGTFTLRANSLPAGTYAYSLIIDGELVQTKKMVLTK